MMPAFRAIFRFRDRVGRFTAGSGVGAATTPGTNKDSDYRRLPHRLASSPTSGEQLLWRKRISARDSTNRLVRLVALRHYPHILLRRPLNVFRRAILGQYWGLTHSRCIVRSDGADEARLEQVDLPATVHLAFDELELRDLTFGSPV